jgi:hypothetical protein
MYNFTFYNPQWAFFSLVNFPLLSSVLSSITFARSSNFIIIRAIMMGWQNGHHVHIF